jgi:mono/diheme cytochrome c family protein
MPLRRLRSSAFHGSRQDRVMKYNTSFLAAAMLAATSMTMAQSADFTTYTGEQLFQRLCASCHGPDAKGNGPVAAALNVTVPNLRELSKRHQGEFPSDKIVKFIDGRTAVAAHGTRVMPVWGDELLRSEAGDPEAEKSAATLIHKIVDYLHGIQEPATK